MKKTYSVSPLLPRCLQCLASPVSVPGRSRLPACRQSQEFTQFARSFMGRQSAISQAIIGSFRPLAPTINMRAAGCLSELASFNKQQAGLVRIVAALWQLFDNLGGALRAACCMLCQSLFTFLTEFSWRCCVPGCDDSRDPKLCFHAICISCDAVALLHRVSPHSLPILKQLVCCPEHESILAGKKACE